MSDCFTIFPLENPFVLMILTIASRLYSSCRSFNHTIDLLSRVIRKNAGCGLWRFGKVILSYSEKYRKLYSLPVGRVWWNKPWPIWLEVSSKCSSEINRTMMCVMSDLNGGEYDFVIYSTQIQWPSLELAKHKHLVTRTYMALLQTPPSRLKTQGQSLSPQPGAEP